MKKVIIILSLLAVFLSSSVSYADPKFKLNLGTTTNDPHPWYLGGEFLAKRVSELTNGDVQITVHGGGSLGNENAMANGMRMGMVDMVILSFTPLASFVPECAAFSIPFMFSGYEHNAKAMDTVNSPLFPLLSKYIADKKLGFSLLATGGGGARCYLSVPRPIVTPEDMKGLKLRTVVNPMTQKVCKILGAIPTPIPATEVYSALQTGVCNALEGSLSFFYSSRHFEVAKYLAKSYQEFIVTQISVSDLTMKKLPEPYRKALKQAAVETGTYITKLGIEMDDKRVAEMVEKHGVKVNDIDKDAFMSLFKPVQDELAESLPGTDRGMELVQAIRGIQQ